MNVFFFTHIDIICHYCRQKGHKKWKCPIRPKGKGKRGKRGGNRGGKNVNIYL
jgi:hypothetical protein